MRQVRSHITTIALQKRIFFALMFSILSLIALYGYFVSKSITNVVLREEIEEHIIAVNSEISRLEFAYLEEKNKITLKFAYDQGFHDIVNKEFVARKSLLGQQLTVNNEI